MDQLCEILDRVDVVMRGRRDELDARHCVPEPRDQLGDLMAGKLAALAGLGALDDLDLELLGPHQVFRGDAEACRRNLLDPVVQPVAVGERLIAGRILTPLARIRFPSHPVHADRQGRVRLG